MDDVDISLSSVSFRHGIFKVGTFFGRVVHSSFAVEIEDNENKDEQRGQDDEPNHMNSSFEWTIPLLLPIYGKGEAAVQKFL
jgi:hypothetical protein